MTTTPKQLRGRNLAAAKRSLRLIIDAAAQHDQILSEGGVPEQDFTASITKYTRALDVIRAMDALNGETAPDDNGEVLVARADLAPFVAVMRGMNPQAGEGPLTRLEAAVAVPVPEPAAKPAPEGQPS